MFICTIGENMIKNQTNDVWRQDMWKHNDVFDFNIQKQGALGSFLALMMSAVTTEPKYVEDIFGETKIQIKKKKKHLNSKPVSVCAQSA